MLEIFLLEAEQFTLEGYLFLEQIVPALLRFRDRHRRAGALGEREGIFLTLEGRHHKVYGRILVYALHRPVLLPAAVPALCRNAVEMQIYASVLKFLYALAVEFAPWIKLAYELVGGAYLALERIQPCHGREGVLALAALDDTVPGCGGNLRCVFVFAVIQGLEYAYGPAHLEYLLELGCRRLVYGFGGTGDVHYPEFLKLLQEGFTLRTEENEGVFHHLIYHWLLPPFLLLRRVCS